MLGVVVGSGKQRGSHETHSGWGRDMECLGAESLKFAKQYVALVEALLTEGVQEKVAREEARIITLMLLYQENGAGEGVCPMCGQT